MNLTIFLLFHWDSVFIILWPYLLERGSIGTLFVQSKVLVWQVYTWFIRETCWLYLKDTLFSHDGGKKHVLIITLSLFDLYVEDHVLSLWKKKTQNKQWSKQMTGKKLLGGSGKSGKNGVFSWSLSAFVNWEFLKGCLAFQDKFPDPVN